MRQSAINIPEILRGFVVGCWAVTFLWLAASGQYEAFLSPELHWLVWVGGVLGIIFLIGMIVGSASGDCGDACCESDSNRIPWLKSIVLVVPLAFAIVAVRDGSLPSRALMTRVLWAGEEGGAAVAVEAGSDEAVVEADIRDIASAPDRWVGRRVRLIGKATHRIVLPTGQFTLFRFTVKCCVADATASAVAVEPADGSRLLEDQWGRIEGVVDVQVVDGKRVPVVRLATVSPAEPPRRPYLLWH